MRDYDAIAMRCDVSGFVGWSFGRRSLVTYTMWVNAYMCIIWIYLYFSILLFSCTIFMWNVNNICITNRKKPQRHRHWHTAHNANSYTILKYEIIIMIVAKLSSTSEWSCLCAPGRIKCRKNVIQELFERIKSLKKVLGIFRGEPEVEFAVECPRDLSFSF